MKPLVAAAILLALTACTTAQVHEVEKELSTAGRHAIHLEVDILTETTTLGIQALQELEVNIDKSLEAIRQSLEKEPTP